MAFVTNQWLKGLSIRDRTHNPVPAEICAAYLDDEWSKRHAVVAGLNLKRSDGDFQTVFFTQKDLATFLSSLVAASDSRTRSRMAVEALSKMNARSLVAALSKVFASKPHGG